MYSGIKVKQSLKCFWNIEMFSVGEQARAGKEVVSLGYEEAEVKLGWVTAEYTAVLDSVQPK